MTPNFVAFTAVCEEDAWYAPQYLAEAERLGIPFAIHFDRCTPRTLRAFVRHRLCVGYTFQPDSGEEFTEQHKQKVFDLAASKGPRWMLGWDVDETFERDAPQKFAEIADRTDADLIDFRWVNLWDDPGHIRTDTIFSGGHRSNLYSSRLNWKFDHPITNGAKAVAPSGKVKKDVRVAKSDLVCLHWGMMTLELRKQHKARWDRIYTKAVGNNPFGFWSYALDEETYPPTVSENPYL